ncbi:MAG: hypothetical protein L0177_09500 [Chloroflexi bacterium]|nr:hypothetical protein [Chloroflexota bacterium]
MAIRRRMNVEARRKVRAVEARRDALMEKKRKTSIELAATRAQLKSMRNSRG